MFPNAFVHTQQFVALWTQMTEEHLARMEQLGQELHAAEGKAGERAREAIDETARLMKESVTYVTQLSADWRKITAEATKKAAATRASTASAKA